MNVAVLTPFERSAARPVSPGRWRKKLLPVGEIQYEGRTLKFTKAYNDSLALAYRSQAYDQVPFQLADSRNTHTNDPERFRGEIISMESLPDGLYIEMKPTSDGEKVLRTNPNLGVSARIVEDYDRADGKFFPRAVQHVLGTLDPRITGMGGWQAVEASNTPSKIVDLTGATYAAGEETGDMPELNEEQRARLAKLLEVPEEQWTALMAGLGASELSDEELDKLSGQGTDGDEDSQLTDEELEEMLAAAEQLDAEGLLEDEGDLADAGAALSGQAMIALDLANARADQLERTQSEIQKRLDAQTFANEKGVIVHNFGIPPHIVDLARPLLEGAGRTVELSNGKAADAGAIVRKIFAELGKTNQMLGLDIELGTPMDEPDVAAEQATQRGDLVSRFKAQVGFE